jgi:hypothetical protein
MSMDRNRALVLLALGLAFIKFILVPWLDQQADSIEQLSVLTKRLDRAEGVIANRLAIEEAVKDTESSVRLARQRFPDAVDPQSFKIGVQQSVSAVAGDTGLVVKLFEWVVEGDAKRARLAYSRARIQIDGGFRQLATLQATLEARFPYMFVREFGLAAPAMIAAPDESVASITIVADFYYRPAPGGMVP